jgi:hypothetical protein
MRCGCGRRSPHSPNQLNARMIWTMAGPPATRKTHRRINGLSRWDALTRYTDDGRLSIDNNLSGGTAERCRHEAFILRD